MTHGYGDFLHLNRDYYSAFHEIRDVPGALIISDFSTGPKFLVKGIHVNTTTITSTIRACFRWFSYIEVQHSYQKEQWINISQFCQLNTKKSIIKMITPFLVARDLAAQMLFYITT